MDVRMIEALQLSGAPELPPPLVRAGRALLGWSKIELARAAGVSISSLQRIEDGDTAATGPANARVRGALEAAGLRFTDTGRGDLQLRMGHERERAGG